MIKSNFDIRYIDVKLGLFFSKLGITPNQWTFLALIPAVIGFLGLYFHNLTFGLVCFAISGVIDAIDGAVARVTGGETNLGAYLDGVVDRYVEILLYLGLLIYGFPGMVLSSSAWIGLLIFGAVMTPYVKAYADHKGIIEPKDAEKMGGLCERFERLMIIFIGMALGYFNIIYLTYSIILAAILANFTVFQRILVTFKAYKRK